MTQPVRGASAPPLESSCRADEAPTVGCCAAAPGDPGGTSHPLGSFTRQILTLFTGVLAALALGEWATAAIVVLFMRVADFAERFTADRARRAVKNLAAMAPQLARVQHDGGEREVPVAELRVGDVVVVRPGE